MTSQNVPTQSSYVNVASKSTVPKKEQAIVCDVIDGISQEQYIYALGEKTKPEHIVAASRITQNRFCWYLSSAHLVDQLTLPGSNKLVIEGTIVLLRPFIARMKRVILSNVHLAVPNELLIEELRKHGVKPQSTITPIKVGVNKPGYTHILSFRRQLFVEPADIDKLPSDFTINHEGSVYHIFVTTDKLVCFSCKKEGHVSKHCKQNEQTPPKSTLLQTGARAQLFSQAPADADADAVNSIVAEDSGDNVDLETRDKRPNLMTQDRSVATKNKEKGQDLNTFNGTTLFTTFKPDHKNEANKRARSSSLSSAADPAVQQTSAPLVNDEFSPPLPPETKKPSNKRSKLHESVLENYITNITAAKVEITQDTADTFPIDFDSLVNFITDIKNDSLDNIPQIVSKYTENYASLLIMLEAIHVHVDASTKMFITRVKKRLKKLIVDGIYFTEDESNFSTDSELTQ